MAEIGKIGGKPFNYSGDPWGKIHPKYWDQNQKGTNFNPEHKRASKGESSPRTRVTDKTSFDNPDRNRTRRGQPDHDQFSKRYDDPIKLTQEKIEAMRKILATSPYEGMPPEIYRAIKKGESVPASQIA